MKEAHRYVVYARGHRPPDQHPRVYVPVMTDLDYARAWMTFFLKGQEFTRDGNTLSLDCGITLKSAELDELLRDTNRTVNEEDYRRILKFKHGSWDEVHSKAEPADDAETKSTPRRERSARAQRPDGYVTITELCAASGMLASDARAILRGSGREKPSYGWAFAPSEIPAIKKLIGIKT